MKQPDKAAWGPGPWQDEPDREAGVASGLPILLRRSPSTGGWCGYVGVPPEHPAYGRGYGDDLLGAIEVHGGLTYAAGCDGDPAHGICHAVASEADLAWWFGFDCGHAWDISPASDALLRTVSLPRLHFPGSSYKSLPYARSETQRLAAQLAAILVLGR